jgi:hypothetical protein
MIIPTHRLNFELPIEPTEQYPVCDIAGTARLIGLLFLETLFVNLLILNLFKCCHVGYVAPESSFIS